MVPAERPPAQAHRFAWRERPRDASLALAPSGRSSRSHPAAGHIEPNKSPCPCSAVTGSQAPRNEGRKEYEGSVVSMRLTSPSPKASSLQDIK